MKNHFLIVAENIIYKNNKLTCINIYDKFTGVTIPAEFMFDLVVVCGPDWEPGTYKIRVEVEVQGEKNNLGISHVNIPHRGFTYNAIANNIKLAINNEIEKITFRVYQEEEIIIKRDYPITAIFNLIKKDEPTINSEQPPKLKIVDEEFMAAKEEE